MYLYRVNPIVRFLITYAIFLAVIGGLFWFYNLNAGDRFTHPAGWAAFGTFAAVTGIVHIFLLKAAERDPKSFIKGFMAANTIKVFVYLGILIVFVLFTKTTPTTFIAEFAAFYFVFTVFEVSMLYGFLRPKK